MEAIIATIGALAGGVITGLFMRRKNNAEAEKTVSEAWKGFAEKMEKRVNDLDVKVEKQEKKIDRFGRRVVYLMGGIEKLLDQIIDADQEPVWTPDDWDPDNE